MKKTNKGLVGIGIVLILGFLLVQGGKPKCSDGDTYSTCEDNIALSFICESGKWVEESSKLCPEVCLEGICVPKQCQGSEIRYSCITPWKALKQNCVDGLFENEHEFCSRNEYCVEGKGCTLSPQTCGNGVCDSGENEINCPRDCGALSSWGEYYDNLPSDVKGEYLECVAEFDCDSEEIGIAVNMMEAEYQPTNPREWIESCSEWIYEHMWYSLGGGDAQCGTTASILLSDLLYSPSMRFNGNCVDASTVYIAMARYKGIPSYQAGVCLTNFRNWKCQMYSFVQPIEAIPEPLGRIDGELNGNVLGHAIAMSWDPIQEKFSPLDPTIEGVGLSKECFGYSPVLEKGIDDQVCYIKNWQDLNWCKGF